MTGPSLDAAQSLAKVHASPGFFVPAALLFFPSTPSHADCASVKSHDLATRSFARHALPSPSSYEPPNAETRFSSADAQLAAFWLLASVQHEAVRLQYSAANAWSGPEESFELPQAARVELATIEAVTTVRSERMILLR